MIKHYLKQHNYTSSIPISDVYITRGTHTASRYIIHFTVHDKYPVSAFVDAIFELPFIGVMSTRYTKIYMSKEDLDFIATEHKRIKLIGLLHGE